MSFLCRRVIPSIASGGFAKYQYTGRTFDISSHVGVQIYDMTAVDNGIWLSDLTNLNLVKFDFNWSHLVSVSSAVNNFGGGFVNNQLWCVNNTSDSLKNYNKDTGVWYGNEWSVASRNSNPLVCSVNPSNSNEMLVVNGSNSAQLDRWDVTNGNFTGAFATFPSSLESTGFEWDGSQFLASISGQINTYDISGNLTQSNVLDLSVIPGFARGPVYVNGFYYMLDIANSIVYEYQG